MNAAMPPRRWASATTWSASVVLPEDSGPKISVTRPRGRPPTPSATSSVMAPVGMTAISSRGPLAPRRMTEPLPNCRSICAIASSRACRRSLFASAMRLSLHHPRTPTARYVTAFEHSRGAPAGASMSGHSDTAPDISAEAHGGQLRVSGAPRGQLAAHERGARDAHPAELTPRGAPQGLGEGRVSPGLAGPAERDVRGEGPLVAGEAEPRERRVHAAGQIDHRAGACGHPGPDDPRTRQRWEGAEPRTICVESVHVRGRPRERADDGADPALGDLAEELHGEMEIPRNHPGDVARHGSQPLDRRPDLSLDGVIEQDRDERADAVYRVSSNCSRFRMPCRRSGSVSAASAARRSLIAPGRSPLSSRSRPRAASARESSGACAGGIEVDAGAEAGGPVPGPGAAAAGAVSDGVSTGGRATG